MAEFQEMCKKYERMCHHFWNHNGGCLKECPLNQGSWGCRGFLMTEPEEAERIIVDWAKEHPVKTNADKFREVFGMSYKSVNNLQFERSIAKFDNFWNQEYEEPSDV